MESATHRRLRRFAVALAFAGPALAAAVEVREIATRPGVTMKFLYAPATAPVASAILFQGGGGDIQIYANGSTRSEGFLATGGDRFAALGLSVAIVDTPSDRRNLHDFRDTAEHAEDAAAIIAFLRREAAVPVWAIGTSNGSLSAANAAARLGERGPQGIVLTASTTRAPVAAAHPVTLAKLDAITVPTLFVHHRDDGCTVTPHSAIPQVMKLLTASPKVELITVEGGDGGGSPCQTGHHQFVGIEAEVSARIATWIRLHSPPPSGPPAR